MTNLPLDDHAAMYVAASRRRCPPCVGVIRRFDERIAYDTLAAYAGQLARNPSGFGRRVVSPRVPGARARWQTSHELPPLTVEPEPVDPAALAELIDEEVSTHPDPSRGAGWRLTAVADGERGSVVLTWLHHAYGDGRGILETAFAPAREATPPPHLPARPIHELGDVVGRLRRGVAGTVRLGYEAAQVGKRTPDGEFARLRPALAALTSRHHTVGSRSQRRIAALVRADVGDWDAAAAARGGSGNTLLVAVLANLLRLARRSRGETGDRPLRILLPFDTRAQTETAYAGNASASNTAGAAIVTLPGGDRDHGELTEVRVAIREALRREAAAVRNGTQCEPIRPPGVIDAMQLLPNAITYRVASRVQANVDGVASNVGAIPAHVARLGHHTAREVYLLASPMLTDVTVCLGRDRSHLSIGVVADPARFGPTGELRQHVAEELLAWGIRASVS